MRIELEVGKRYWVIIDPLSHGENMRYYKAQLEVMDRQDPTVSVFDTNNSNIELEPTIHLAVCRIVAGFTVDSNGTPVDDDGSWGSGLVGGIETLIAVDGNEDWSYTEWPSTVEFVSEEEK